MRQIHSEIFALKIADRQCKKGVKECTKKLTKHWRLKITETVQLRRYSKNCDQPVNNN